LVGSEGPAVDDVIHVGVAVVVVGDAPLYVSDVGKGLIIEGVVGLKRGPGDCCEVDGGGGC
jgi:hypothetical protein